METVKNPEKMCLILHGYSHVIKNLNPLDPVRLRGTVEPSSGPSVLVVCTEAINHSFLLRVTAA